MMITKETETKVRSTAEKLGYITGKLFAFALCVWSIIYLKDNYTKLTFNFHTVIAFFGAWIAITNVIYRPIKKLILVSKNKKEVEEG